ncbi:MAG: hypothetical protein U0234_08350 [Sandaracinus sp.]
MMRAGVGMLVAVGLLGLAASARADSVDMPRACPPGARGQTAHEGQWCVVADCTAGCREGETCTSLRVCTQTASVVPGGLRATEPPPEPRELVVATCEPSSTCTGLEEPPPPIVGTLPATPPTCAVRQVCVMAALADLPPEVAPAPSVAGAPSGSGSSASVEVSRSSSCACRGPGARRASSWPVLVVGVSLIAGWRARRRGGR